MNPSADGHWPGDAWPTTAMHRGFLAGANANRLDLKAVVRLNGLTVADNPAPKPEDLGLPRIKPRDWMPMGILATYDLRACQIIASVAQTNLVLGKDVGVVGCLDLEGSRTSPKPPSTWTIDRRALGAEAVHELMARIENPQLSRSTVKISMDFLDRGTV